MGAAPVARAPGNKQCERFGPGCAAAYGPDGPICFWAWLPKAEAANSGAAPPGSGRQTAGTSTEEDTGAAPVLKAGSVLGPEVQFLHIWVVGNSFVKWAQRQALSTAMGDNLGMDWDRYKDQRQRPLETSAIPFAAKSRKIDRLVDIYTAGNTGPSLDDGFHGGSLVELIAVFYIIPITYTFKKYAVETPVLITVQHYNSVSFPLPTLCRKPTAL
ncbi:hypothetical protein NDU88_000946 [Pleurodeles waltl]|uniref:Uncharacterized protein n=1 Tax=Pleurodeles waltl TaxID=8319 RepID=A0AAV7SXV7_PLEWA|nr:hypothetical protein NDU88_000946 [Pleurodeles waltl]